MDDLKNILIISTAFPPSTGCGVQRIIRLCRGFSAIGYVPTVLTTTCRDIDNLYDSKFSEISDGVIRAPYVSIRDFLRGLLPKTMTIISKDGGNPEEQIFNESTKRNTIKSVAKEILHGYLEFPDNANTWIIPAISKGTEIAQKRTFHCIYSSSPRVSSHVVAAVLAARLKIPWIMEFRDLWAGNPQTSQPQPWPRHSCELWLESWLMRRASEISTVSAGSKQMLVDRYGEDIGQKIVVFPHGYDKSERNSVRSASKELPLVIAHTGIFYNGRRDITGLYRALQGLIDEKRLLNDEISLWFAGDIDKYAIKSAENCKLSPSVKDFGYIPISQSLEIQESAHILLLVERAEDTDWVFSQMPGKLFEYLGAGRPILALVNPDSMIAGIIRETNTGVVFAPDDVAGIMNYLAEQLEYLKQNRRLRFEPNQEKLARHDWINTIKLIGNELDQLIAAGSATL